MSDHDLQQQVAKLNLLSSQQRSLVQNDIANNERALYGGPMQYTGADFAAQSYEPGGGSLGAETAGFMGRAPLPVPEPDIIRRNLEMDRRTLALGSPPEMSGHRRNLLYKLYKNVVAEYKEGLLSHGQMWDANIANIHHHMRHEEANRNRGQFIRNMRKIFEPEEDDFSLDELRPHDPIRINSAAFRRHFDDIQWSENDEMARQMDELDDLTYFQFLELKARTNDSSVIMTKLMIDRQTYEACEARLAASHADLGEADQDAPPAPESENSVPERYLEVVIQHVMMHPNCTYRELLKSFNLKSHGMKVNDFAKTLKHATSLKFLERNATKHYVLATELTETIPSLLQEESENSDSEEERGL